MTDVRMPDGVLLRNAEYAPCGCLIGEADPATLGVPHNPGQSAIACVPCGTDCPTFHAIRTTLEHNAAAVFEQVRGFTPEGHGLS